MNKKSIWAVAAGVLFIIIVTTLVDIALHIAAVYPPAGQPLDDSLALLATSYRIVISVIGAYLTAWLAFQNPMRHAMILGYIGTGLGLIGLAVTWNLALAPKWHPIALAVLAVPQCWAGGWLFETRSGRRRAKQETWN